MAVHVIVYGHRVVALSIPLAVALAAHIAVLEADHPIARWVAAMIIFSDLVNHSELNGPFHSSVADAFASMVLLADREVAALAHLPDCQLAELFNVPLKQIAAKRAELAALGLTDPPTSGWPERPA